MKLSLVAVAIASLAAAQTETFDVASIKLSDPMSPETSFHFGPSQLRVSGATLKDLILFAYDLREFQLVGAAGWMSSERYAILAKNAEAPQVPPAAAGALIRKRVQALLADRFRLALHRETRELPMYALVVARGGVKMTRNTSPEETRGGWSTGRGTIKATHVDARTVATNLAEVTGRPVRDETGLDGFFDLKLTWTPEAPAAAPGDDLPSRPAGPTLFTAIQEQLGLKLESKKGPVEVLVIDRAERPSEN